MHIDRKQLHLIQSWKNRADEAARVRDYYGAFISMWIALNAFCYARYVDEAVKLRADLGKVPAAFEGIQNGLVTGELETANGSIKIKLKLPAALSITLKRKYTEDLIFRAFEKAYTPVHKAKLEVETEYRRANENLRDVLANTFRYRFKTEPFIINMARVGEFRDQPSSAVAAAKGIITLFKDDKFASLLRVLYQVRCNVFHGEKTPGGFNDDEIVAAAYPLLKNVVSEVMINKLFRFLADEIAEARE